MSSPDVFNQGLGKNISLNDLPQQLRFSAEVSDAASAQEHCSISIRQPVVSYVLGGWARRQHMRSTRTRPLLKTSDSLGSLQPNQQTGWDAAPVALRLKIGPDGKPMSPYAVN